MSAEQGGRSAEIDAACNWTKCRTARGLPGCFAWCKCRCHTRRVAPAENACPHGNDAFCAICCGCENCVIPPAMGEEVQP